MKKRLFTGKFVLAILLCLLISNLSYAQQPLDYQLRLEPVWARVADALGEVGSVESAEFSPDGKYIVSGTKFDNSVVMWRTSDGAELWRQYASQEVERVGWSADGKYVAAASEDFLVTVYDAGTGKTIRTIKHKQGIDGLTWSNKGSLLVTGEEKIEQQNKATQGWVRVFQMPEGREIKSLDFGSTVNELFFSQDDQYLLAVGHESVKVYRVSDWSLVKTLNPSFNVNYTSGVFSPDGKYVAAVGTSDQARGNVFVWEWESGKLVKHFNHTGKKIESISWHPNGNYIAHAGHDPYIYVYRVADIMKFQNDNIPVAHKVWAGDHAEYIDLNADGSFLVSAHQNGLIKLWAWMGEESDVNARRHHQIIQQQSNKH
ncbi:WD40 repeat-containing protein [Flammeovirgaceae bacterium 311]|nr:WD40 repeat-containing protein [Flammeovirgaceae bacterium 311]